MFLFFVSGTSVPMALIAAALSGAAYGAIWTLIPRSPRTFSGGSILVHTCVEINQ